MWIAFSAAAHLALIPAHDALLTDGFAIVVALALAEKHRENRIAAMGTESGGEFARRNVRGAVNAHDVIGAIRGPWLADIDEPHIRGDVSAGELKFPWREGIPGKLFLACVLWRSLDSLSLLENVSDFLCGFLTHDGRCSCVLYEYGLRTRSYKRK